jgi:hypothetical protein
MRWSLALAVVVTLWLGGCDVDQNNSYSLVADVRDAGLFEYDRLPDILPPSAYDIRYIHNAGFNHFDGEFSFDPAEFADFAAQFESFYQPFEYSEGDQTWVFFCDAATGHCYYSTR